MAELSPGVTLLTYGQGRICTSPCTSIRWVPSSPNLFLVSHADGTILLYDKEREDGMFAPRDPDAGFPPPLDLNGSPHSSFTPAGPWNPLDSIFVTLPPWHPASIASNGKADKEKDRAPKNPVSHWRVSKKKVVGSCFRCIHISTHGINVSTKTLFSLQT